MAKEEKEEQEKSKKAEKPEEAKKPAKSKSEEGDGKEGDGAGEEGEEGEGKKSGGKKMIIIIAAAAVLVGGVVFGVVFFLLGGSNEEGEVTEEVVEVTEVVFYDIPQISTNMLTDGRTNRFLKIKISLELGSELDIPPLEAVMPRVQDDFQTFLRQLRVEDIKGSHGMQRLKEGLLLRANQSAAPVKIRNVLFKEIIVQ